jgi:hypothetical protein
MNIATRIIVSTLGVLFAISGLSHGFFETLQGYKPTDGFFIAAIGESHRMWIHGGEHAFTIIPNFLITGIASILVSIAIIIWSIGFVHKKNGPLVFILLYILLFLVGGGVAQVIFFTLTWAVATRINRPLSWWRRILPQSVCRILAVLWPWTLSVGSFLMLAALFIAITGYFPGSGDPAEVLYIMIFFIGIAFILFHITFLSGFADDINRSQKTKPLSESG